jgi:hypothetical protein
MRIDWEQHDEDDSALEGVKLRVRDLDDGETSAGERLSL